MLETIPETVTPAAESFAREKGMYESLIRTKGLVRKIMPSTRSLSVDIEDDPDEGGYTSVCLQITTSEPVERVLELDSALENALIDQIPPEHRIFLTFAYQFE